MGEVDREQIAAGVKDLGLPEGAILMVHSSLSSLGHVVGGADTVIDALLEALGPEGTLLMPTHPARDGQVFDVETVPSDMGSITETFRRRDGVLRSRHPYHPVAACGARAEELLRDHEHSAIPDGPETPYGRLITEGGWVLHIGCDLDTLTLVHTIEAELDLPYLRDLEMEYLDEKGAVQTLEIRRCPGGHRGGVLQFDRLFREEGAMTVGKIGNAVCRLISAPRAAAIMRREMGHDPFFALDDNPHCVDCVRFRGKIKAARLAKEEFRLSAPLWATDDGMDHELSVLEGEGIRSVDVDARLLHPSPAWMEKLKQRLVTRDFEVMALRARMDSLDVMRELCGVAQGLGAKYLHITPDESGGGSEEALLEALKTLASIAQGAGVTLLLVNRPGSITENVDKLSDIVLHVDSSHVRASYDPAAFARMGGSPFYEGLYKGSLSRVLEHVELRDVVARDGGPTRLGRGNAEIVEILSRLRCRSFTGSLTLWAGEDAQSNGLHWASKGFWDIMDSI